MWATLEGGAEDSGVGSLQRANREAFGSLSSTSTSYSATSKRASVPSALVSSTSQLRPLDRTFRSSRLFDFHRTPRLASSPDMSGQYPPHDGRGPYPSSSPYADPFQDSHSTQPAHGGRQDSSQGSYAANLGGDISGGGGGPGPQRYALSDTPSFQGSTQTLPTASSYSLADPDQEKSYDGGYHGQEDDDEARPLRDAYNGGGGFYRPEGQE